MSMGRFLTHWFFEGGDSSMTPPHYLCPMELMAYKEPPQPTMGCIKISLPSCLPKKGQLSTQKGLCSKALLQANFSEKVFKRSQGTPKGGY